MSRAAARAALVASILALSSCCTPAAAPPPPSPPPSPPPASVAPPAPHDTSETESDRVITERARTLFREDFEIVRVQPRVVIATAGGVVTLTGSVETDRQRQVMAGHVRAIEGVSLVTDHLALAP